jgi:type II secretory pathway pseudopilin PulG
MKVNLAETGGVRHWKNKTGETLVEVIIALFIITIGTGAATSLIVNAMQANSFNKDNLVANVLAKEGIEVLRTIRDSNWLKFSFDKDKCWNVKPEITGSDVCNVVENRIEGGNYTVDVVPATYSWILAGPFYMDDLYDEEYRLGYVDLTGVVDSPELIVSKSVFEVYPANQFGQSKYHRMVTIEYLDGNKETASKLKATSRVGWKVGNRAHAVVLSTILTNHQ